MDFTSAGHHGDEVLCMHHDGTMTLERRMAVEDTAPSAWLGKRWRTVVNKLAGQPAPHGTHCEWTSAHVVGRVVGRV